MRKGTKHIKGVIRNRSLKIRLNDAEYDELDAVAIKLNITKAEITRNAIKQYLAQDDIEIWNN